MTTEFDKALAELHNRLGDIALDINGYQRQINLLATERAAVEGEIKGLERARDLFGPPSAETRSPQRRAVQKPVLALFGPGQGSWTLELIVERTGLPDVAVQKFLSHAIKNGKLRRLPTSAPGPNAEYGLPVRTVGEAAE